MNTGKIGNEEGIRMFKTFNDFTDLRERLLHNAQHWLYFTFCIVKRRIQVSLQQNPPLLQQPPSFTELPSFAHYSSLSSLAATILPQLLLRHPLPQQLRLFVAAKRAKRPICRSCQALAARWRYLCSTTLPRL